MKHFFSGRHGSYDGNNRQSQYGKEQIEMLAGAIEEIIQSGSVHLVSSTAPRAIDGAEVLAKHFGLTDFDRVAYLWTANDAPRDVPNYDRDYGEDRRAKLLSIAEDRKDLADGLVVVSHLGAAESLAHAVASHYDVNLRLGELTYGRSAHLDLEHKKTQILPLRE